jgi:hypothetical protein
MRTFPVYYEFKTSWDGITWTAPQKRSARRALDYLSGAFPEDVVFVETIGPAAPGAAARTTASAPPDVTLRWAGGDFFKDWTAANPGFFQGWTEAQKKPYRMQNYFGLAVKPDPSRPVNLPWDTQKYPVNEIYFNTQEAWNYNPFIVDEFALDFWSILLHEMIHMMSVGKHAVHRDEVMYAEIEYGERKWELKQSDLDLLKDAGYQVSSYPLPISAIPLPAPALLLISALASLAAARALRRAAL